MCRGLPVTIVKHAEVLPRASRRRPWVEGAPQAAEGEPQVFGPGEAAGEGPGPFSLRDSGSPPADWCP